MKICYDFYHFRFGIPKKFEKFAGEFRWNSRISLTEFHEFKEIFGLKVCKRDVTSRLSWICMVATNLMIYRLFHPLLIEIGWGELLITNLNVISDNDVDDRCTSCAIIWWI